MMAACELGCPVASQQTHQGGRDGAEIGAAVGGANQQSLAGRSRVGEMIGGAMAACGPLVCSTRAWTWAGILDPIALVVAARMAGEDLAVPSTMRTRSDRPARSAIAAPGCVAPSNRSDRSGRRVSCRP